jgi:DNA-binding winged helix-turn-helix (wHTH) protein
VKYASGVACGFVPEEDGTEHRAAGKRGVPAETSLAALVTQLRKALGDASGDGRVIRTLHRVGYAFIGDAVVAGRALALTDGACFRLGSETVRVELTIDERPTKTAIVP